MEIAKQLADPRSRAVRWPFTLPRSGRPAQHCGGVTDFYRRPCCHRLDRDEGPHVEPDGTMTTAKIASKFGISAALPNPRKVTRPARPGSVKSVRSWRQRPVSDQRDRPGKCCHMVSPYIGSGVPASRQYAIAARAIEAAQADVYPQGGSATRSWNACLKCWVGRSMTGVTSTSLQVMAASRSAGPNGQRAGGIHLL